MSQTHSQNYAEYTRDSTEILKRLVHKRRLAQATKFIKPKLGDKILDFGCGDAHLFEQFERQLQPDLFGYDPDEGMLNQANHKYLSQVTLISDVTYLKKNFSQYFDLIICIEVFEHLDPQRIDFALNDMQCLLKPGGRIVIGVPIETGLSGFLKNCYRTIKGKRMGADFMTAIRSATNQRIERCFDNKGWSGSHVGFSHHEFECRLNDKGLVTKRVRCIPVSALGIILNNEIYYECFWPQ